MNHYLFRRNLFMIYVAIQRLTHGINLNNVVFSENCHSHFLQFLGAERYFEYATCKGY